MSQCPLILPMMVLLAMSIGCSSPDTRLAELARSTSQEQVEQNERMAVLQQEVAAGSRQLVEAESRRSTEFLSLQRDLQTQSAEISRQLDALEDERKELARERRTVPVIASAINATVTLIACLLPLVVCIYLLLPQQSQVQAQALTDLLIEELASRHSSQGDHTPRVTAAALADSVLPDSNLLT